MARNAFIPGIFELSSAARKSAGKTASGTDTVYEATANASRYLFFHSPCYELVIEDPSPHLPGCITVRFDVQLERAVPQRQLIDAYLSSTYRMAQSLSPIPLRLQGVSLPHSPVGERSAYRSHFDAPVAFEQPYAAIHLERAKAKFSDCWAPTVQANRPRST